MVGFNWTTFVINIHHECLKPMNEKWSSFFASSYSQDLRPVENACSYTVLEEPRRSIHRKKTGGEEGGKTTQNDLTLMWYSISSK